MILNLVLLQNRLEVAAATASVVETAVLYILKLIILHIKIKQLPQVKNQENTHILKI